MQMSVLMRYDSSSLELITSADSGLDLFGICTITLSPDTHKRNAKNSEVEEIYPT
jgi:hypothetical protein